MKTRGIKIVNGGNMSLNDLKKAKKTGYCVTRTSHIGNQYLSNLALLASGFPAQLYDRNLTVDDKNYWPAHVIYGGQQFFVGPQENILTPFARLTVKNHSSPVAGLVNGYRNVADLHYSSLKKTFGGLVNTESQFYSAQAEVAEELSAILYFYFPDLFNRRVLANGATIQSDVKLSSSKFCQANRNTLKALQGFLLQDDNVFFQSGVLPTLNAVLVINSALGALSTDRDVIYELAGPDMATYAYVNNRQFALDKIYTTLAADFKGLPDLIQLTVVPTFDFRFAALASEMSSLEDLVDNLLFYRQIIADKRIAINNVKKDRKNTLELQEELQKISAPLSNKAKELTHDMHKHSYLVNRMLAQDSFREGRFFSHYDLLTADETLCVNKMAEDFTMSECQALLRILTESKRLLKR